MRYRHVKVNVENASGERIGTQLSGESRDHVMTTLVQLHDPFQAKATGPGMSKLDWFDSQVLFG